MTHVLAGARNATTLLLVVLLCGCAWLHARTLSPIPAERKHVLMLSPAPLPIVGGQRYAGPAQRQDYVLMRGAAGQAELIYIDAVGRFGRAAIKYHGERLRQFTAGWAINASGIRNWGTRHELDTPLARFRYVPYATVRPQRGCAAFQALWDIPPGDIERRPGKLIFGYYCGKPGMPLDKQTLAGILSGLRIGFHSRSSGVAPIPVSPARTDDNSRGYHPFPRLLPIFQPSPFGNLASPMPP